MDSDNTHTVKIKAEEELQWPGRFSIGNDKRKGTSQDLQLVGAHASTTLS
jgi:hypothetical protein